MKPFDLKKALAGAKLITRSGEKVINFQENTESDNLYPFMAIVIEDKLVQT